MRAAPLHLSSCSDVFVAIRSDSRLGLFAWSALTVSNDGDISASHHLIVPSSPSPHYWDRGFNGDTAAGDWLNTTLQTQLTKGRDLAEIKF